MKTQTQPQHTQEEWIQNGVNGIHTKEGHCIALTYGIGYGADVRAANAKRIVKCVNAEWKIDMHDELVGTIKRVQGLLTASDKSFERFSAIILKDIEQLLKQAEQK